MKNIKKPVLGMILKGYPRISETFISNEILLLEKLGFSIHIFSMRHPRESFSHKSVEQIKAGVDYLPHTILRGFFSFAYHNFFLAVKKPKEYIKALKTAFKRFRRTRKSATIKHLLQAGYLVNKLLSQTQVVHFHAHFAHSPASVAMFSSILSGLPFSFTAHAKDIYTSHKGQIKEKISLAKFVVTCTQYNKNYLKKIASGLKTPIYRVYHGIYLGLFSRQKAMDHVSPPYKILTIARIVEKKGLATVYKALFILKQKGVDFSHNLIGDGDDRNKIIALIKDLGLKDQCRWLGTLPHEKVLEYYRNSHVFVLGCQIASNGDRDGIPNVLAESMAMGVPVAATRVSAIPELIRDKKEGLLVEPGRPEKLAQAIERLLTDITLRKNIIKSANKKIHEIFDNKVLIARLGEIYQKEVPGLNL